jgi:hypothetical protein
LDHRNKKLKIKEHGQKPKLIHGNSKRESAEVPRQQKVEAIEGGTIRTQLQKQSSQIGMKEPKVETSLAETIAIGESSSALVLKSQEYHTFETPLAVMCPKVLQPSHHNGKSIFKELLHICFIRSALEHPTFRLFRLWSLGSHRWH